MKKRYHLLSLGLTISISILTLFGCGSNSPNPTETSSPTPTETTDANQNYLGVNFNEKLDAINYDNLARTKTTWVRGFLPFFKYYNKPQSIENDERIKQYLTLKEHNYQTILNIKWDFSEKSFPKLDSEEMNNYLTFLKEKLYAKIWDKTDILVIGNEPFIEYDKSDPSKKAEFEAELVKFYSKVADETVKYRQNQSKKIPIYVGAFNNLYNTKWQTTATADLLKYVKENSEIAGIDLHIHHSNLDEVTKVLDYITPQITTSQKIIVTEFSLKNHFKAQLNQPISSDFLNKYQSLNPAYKNFKTNLDYLNYIFEHGTVNQPTPHTVSKEEWYDYLKMSPWFENNKFYLENMFAALKKCPNFYLATYAFQQGFAANTVISAKTDPWFFNGLYANFAIQSNTGAPEFNYAWIDSFLKIQAETDSSK